MKYDFESIIERHGQDALAVDRPAQHRAAGEGYFSVPVKDGFDIIPMWVADMNYAVAPSIPRAIKKRMKHPVYGYFEPRQEYYDAIIKWQSERNHVEGLTAECIGYENGVLGGVVSAAGILCSAGDKILVNSPTYVGFMHSLCNVGYELVHSPMVLEENKELIANNDTTGYLEKVEKPILAFAKKYYKDKGDPSWDIYSLGSKPKFDNVFKNMFIECGPILDITDGKYKISTSCFSDGIKPSEYHLYANQAIFGAYSRAVNTAYGGAKTKEFTAAFQSLVVTEDDCKSQDTIDVEITNGTVNDVKWRWIKSTDKTDPTYDGNGFVLLTPDKAKKMIGQTVQCRSPLFCRSDNLCWKCVGEIYKRTGLKNIGLTLSKLTAIFLNTSLKSMHDVTIKTFEMDPKACFYTLN